MKLKLSDEEARKCEKCPWRSKLHDEVVMCPVISCINERIKKKNERNSKRNICRHS